MNESQELNNLKKKVADLERILTLHTHTGSDKTKIIGDGNIILKKDRFLVIGKMAMANNNLNEGLSNETNRLGIATGSSSDLGYGYKTENSELFLEHQENTALSFFYGFRPPLYSGPEPGDAISVTTGDNKIIDFKKTFTINELAGAYVTIAGTTSGTIETHLISSNTANTITISTTWGITEGVTYIVFIPIYLGAANYPWKRLYLIGDLRFGRGSSSGANVIYIKYGEGSPEGVVTANVGSLYLRSDGGAGTTLYVKESGSGNTGWAGV